MKVPEIEQVKTKLHLAQCENNLLQVKLDKIKADKAEALRLANQRIDFESAAHKDAKESSVHWYNLVKETTAKLEIAQREVESLKAELKKLGCDAEWWEADSHERQTKALEFKAELDKLKAKDSADWEGNADHWKDRAEFWKARSDEWEKQYRHKNRQVEGCGVTTLQLQGQLKVANHDIKMLQDDAEKWRFSAEEWYSTAQKIAEELDASKDQTADQAKAKRFWQQEHDKAKIDQDVQNLLASRALEIVKLEREAVKLAGEAKSHKSWALGNIEVIEANQSRIAELEEEVKRQATMLGKQDLEWWKARAKRQAQDLIEYDQNYHEAASHYDRAKEHVAELRARLVTRQRKLDDVRADRDLVIADNVLRGGELREAKEASDGLQLELNSAKQELYEAESRAVVRLGLLKDLAEKALKVTKRLSVQSPFTERGKEIDDLSYGAVFVLRHVQDNG